MRSPTVALLTCALMSLGIAGCSGGGGEAEPELVPVSGTVTLDGDPVEGVSVMFGGVSLGTSDETGHYELSYQGKKPGVPVGSHVVMCEKWVMPDGSVYRSDEAMSPMDAGATQVLPVQYTGADSTLVKEVPEGGGTIDIEMKSGGPPTGEPGMAPGME